MNTSLKAQTYVNILMYTYTYTHIFSRTFSGFNVSENVFTSIQICVLKLVCV